MFHGETIKTLKNLKIHELLFYVFLFLIPIQTRILFQPETAYISWYFDYHLAFFVYLTDILLVACFVSWIMFDKPKGLLQKRLFWLILAFFCLILVTLFHVKRLDLGWYQTLKWAELLGLILYIRETYQTRFHFLVSSIVLFVSGVIQAILGLIQFHVQHNLGFSFLGEYIAPLGTSGLATIETTAGKVIRAYGTFPHPNVLGAFLVLSLILGLYLLSRIKNQGSKINTALVACGTILITLGLFVTFSRTAWLAGALAYLLFTIYYLLKDPKKKAFLIIGIGIVSCMSVVVLTQTDATIFGLYNGTLKARVFDSNPIAIADRASFNQIGLNLTGRFPSLGVGVGNYVEALKDLYKLEPWQNQPAHNMFIFLSAELGILGVALFIIILFEIFSGLRLVSWDTLTSTLAVLGIIFLLMSQTDHYFVTIQQGRLALFVVLGLISALPNLQRE
jgi:O-antigen ligase